MRQPVAHQWHREIAPGIARIGYPDTSKNVQPRLASAVLLIAEVTPRPQRARLQIEVFARQRQAMFIALPAHGTGNLFNLERSLENIAIRHGRRAHINADLAMIQAATRFAA